MTNNLIDFVSILIPSFPKYHSLLFNNNVVIVTFNMIYVLDKEKTLKLFSQTLIFYIYFTSLVYFIKVNSLYFIKLKFLK